MDTQTNEPWQQKKDGLKSEFRRWLLHCFDVTAALDAWVAYRREAASTPQDILLLHRLLVAFITTYARPFNAKGGGLNDQSPWGLPTERQRIWP